MTFSITSLSYRQLQRVLDRPENTVKRNAKGDVLRAECERLLSVGVLTTEYLSSLPAPTPARAPRAKFDWDGLANDRKDAVNILKTARSKGFIVPKLNSSNELLLAALTLEQLGALPTPESPESSSATAHTPLVSKVHTGPRPTTRPATIATIPTVTVKTETKPELTQLEKERAECKKLLQERESLEIQLCIKPDDVTLQERLTECKALIHEMPARAFC